ncbi:Asp_Glu_race domain-containing protein [Cephalotus follicularis]|uniref:Asp_Glu_race domain-containing protein n=1 Tax=Cephalotus follicularis TaxID=3775 RepID=A0A1Q3BDK5_CEPFO|nr:Asp_Glu_race domain-containing protein [Cephalotus follicularis]
MSFPILNYTSHILGHVTTHRTPYGTRLNPPLAVPSSSILLQTDESDKWPGSNKASGLNTASTNCDSLLSQANTVGIIGGVSVDSTLNFLRKVVEWSSRHEKDSPPFVLCSDPVLNKELLTHERNCMPYVNCKSERSQLDLTPVMENLRGKRFFLEKSGARCIVMPCHISQSWYDEVSKGSTIPFLNMGECVAKELKEAKLKPLEAGSPLRIGVLGTNTTLTAEFYQDKLQSEGFEVVLPDKATMEHTVIPAIEALNRKDIEGARNLLRIALQVLLVTAVNTIILASDDMRDLLPQDDPLLKKCIDPMDALVRSTIKWAQSAVKGTC